MSTANNAEIWVLTMQALHAHAAELRREAASRGNYGPQNKEHRAFLRDQARLALAIERSVSNVSSADLAALLATGTLPAGIPVHGPVTIPLRCGHSLQINAADESTARRNGWLYCQDCRGKREIAPPREPFTGDLPLTGNPYPMV